MEVARRAAISTAIAVLGVVLIVAAAGIGYYYIATSSGTSSSSSTSNSSTGTTSASSMGSSTGTSATSSSTTPTSSQQSSTQSSQQSSTTGQSTSSFTTESCSATTTGTAGNPSLNALAVIQEFQAMTLQYSVTNDTSGATQNYTDSFQVVSTTATAYLVNATSVSTLENLSLSYQAKVEKTGTVDWVFYKFGTYSLNESGFQAATLFEGAMTFFELELASNQIYSYSQLTQYFHQEGGTNTLSLSNMGTGQSVSIDYQTYVANSPDESFGYCGSNISFSEFTLWLGTIHNTSTQVMAKFHIKGVVNGNSEDITLSLNWVWLQP